MSNSLPESFNFNTVPRCHIGAGSSSLLPEVCRSLGINNPLLVTDRGIVACGLLAPVEQLFDAAGLPLSLYTETLADPPEQNVLDAVAVAVAQGCDGVIGFGGGSSMDVAKLVAALIGAAQRLPEMYGVDMITGSRLPLIQIPTTAGTGSEATAVAIVTTGESTKAGVVSPILFADCILLDAELTLGLPAQVTAATGIDAMVHAMEAFTSVRLKNPMSDMVALQALDLLSRNIRIAVEQGTNSRARSDMLLGAMLAGQAFANAPVGAVHALAYPLGGTYHIPHGLSNSLVLPHVIRFNASPAGDWYLQLCAAIDGLDAASLTAETAGSALADYFASLASDLGLQTTLREMDIEQSALADLAAQSMNQQRLLINNPREVNEAQALEIYQQAW